MSKNSKAVSVLIITFVLLGALAVPAFAAGGATNITFAGASFVPGKGPVFTFTVNGELSQSQLNSGFLRTSTKTYSLYCVQTNATTVKCTAPKAAAGDLSGFASLAGFGSFASVPSAPSTPATPAYCYDVKDLGIEIRGYVDIDTHCQDNEAVHYDEITHYSPWAEQDVPFTYHPEWEEGAAYYFSGE